MKAFTKIGIVLCLSYPLSATAPSSSYGVDPVHSALNSHMSSKLKEECKKNPNIEKCEQSIIYDRHLKENTSKGVDLGQFNSSTGGSNWISALQIAANETLAFARIDEDISTNLDSSIRSGVAGSATGDILNHELGKLEDSIDAITALMEIVAKQALIEHRIETVIMQQELGNVSAKELREFEMPSAAKGEQKNEK